MEYLQVWQESCTFFDEWNANSYCHNRYFYLVHVKLWLTGEILFTLCRIFQSSGWFLENWSQLHSGHSKFLWKWLHHFLAYTKYALFNPFHEFFSHKRWHNVQKIGYLLQMQLKCLKLVPVKYHFWTFRSKRKYLKKISFTVRFFIRPPTTFQVLLT